MFLKISCAFIIVGFLIVTFSMFDILGLNSFDVIEEYFDNKSKKEIFRIQDYGFTALIIGFTIFALLKNGWKKFKTPSSTRKTFVLGIITLITTTFGLFAYVLFSILRSSGYESFIGDLKNSIDDIPMTFFPFVIWFIANISGINDDFKAGGLVKDLLFKSYNLWYSLVLVTTLILLVCFICIGNPWLTLMAILWSYLYISIMMGRQNSRIEKNIC